ncbi:MAG: M1 family metallopeptidase [bacterium]
MNLLAALGLLAAGMLSPPQAEDLPPIYRILRPGSAPACAESSHSWDARHYRLDIELPMTHAGYRCREEVSLISNRPRLDTVPLDFAGLVCDSVRRYGSRLAFDTSGGRLDVRLDSPLAQGDSTVLEIFFRRESLAEQRGYFFGRPPTIRYAHGMTCGCPTDNHYWFACWDHPSDKAERGVELNLTLPDSFQTCAVGLCDSITDNGNGARTWWWRHPYPIATYLISFSASRFASWDTWFVNTTGETIPVRHWMWPEDSAATRTGYAQLPEVIEYFIRPDIFGAYPFETFGHVPGYYGFPWGGMEHQTLVMLNAGYIGGGRISTIAHELSHMWWGDMVTHVGYADVWLNEGFATYAECLAMGALFGRDYFRNYIANKGRTYINRDRYMRMPIYDPPWEHIYDVGHIYSKGAWVQHMLRGVMGDTAWDAPGVFFAAQRAYGDSFRYGTVATEDYRRIVEQVHGEDLGWFFDEWVYQAGYPKYHFEWTAEGSRLITTLGQRNGERAPDFFRIPLPVRAGGAGADTLLFIRPRANPQVDTFELAWRAESLVVDPDNWVLDSCYLTGIAEGSPGPQPAPRLLSALPNPARGAVRFEVAGPPGAGCLVEVFDRAGRRADAVSGRYGPTGRTQLEWRRDRTGPGVYFCRVAGSQATVKLVLAE